MKRQKRFQCPFPGCDKRFKYVSFFERHIKTHTGNDKGRFICTIDGCGTRWESKRALESHFETHPNSKPFCCKYPGCHKAFGLRLHLHSHEKTHTQQKPFACDLCDKRYKTKLSLINHITQKHPNEKNLLEKVKQRANAKEPLAYKCPYCEKVYTRSHTRKQHIDKHHANEAQPGGQSGGQMLVNEVQIRASSVITDIRPLALHNIRASRSVSFSPSPLPHGLRTANPKTELNQNHQSQEIGSSGLSQESVQSSRIRKLSLPGPVSGASIHEAMRDKTRTPSFSSMSNMDVVSKTSSHNRAQGESKTPSATSSAMNTFAVLSNMMANKASHSRHNSFSNDGSNVQAPTQLNEGSIVGNLVANSSPFERIQQNDSQQGLPQRMRHSSLHLDRRSSLQIPLRGTLPHSHSTQLHDQTRQPSPTGNVITTQVRSSSVPSAADNVSNRSASFDRPPPFKQQRDVTGMNDLGLISRTSGAFDLSDRLSRLRKRLRTQNQVSVNGNGNTNIKTPKKKKLLPPPPSRKRKRITVIPNSSPNSQQSAQKRPAPARFIPRSLALHQKKRRSFVPGKA